MSNRELIAEASLYANDDGRMGMPQSPNAVFCDLICRLAAALSAHEWQPIESAPTTPFTPIEVGWWEDGWEALELVQMLLPRADWAPNSEKKIWLNLNSNNYHSIKQAHQWPTHWRLPAPPTE
jgi:hypothetical protein